MVPAKFVEKRSMLLGSALRRSAEDNRHQSLRWLGVAARCVSARSWNNRAHAYVNCILRNAK
jgi:hypothetical protein